MAVNPHSVLPRRVLIVDDDERVRESPYALLSGADFEVGVAADGAEALIHIGRQWYPIIIVISPAMSVIDGIEFAQRLRAGSVASEALLRVRSARCGRGGIGGAPARGQ